MTQRRINARDIIVQVSDGAGSPTWLAIEHLAGVVPKPGENEEVAETTDFDSLGVYEQEIMQRGASMDLEGLELKDDLSGVLPPGRARVEALASETAVGYLSLGQIRFRHPMDTVWRVWNCTVSLDDTGGKNNDKSSWGATITKSGPTITTAVS
jgi:hypothetical protein